MADANVDQYTFHIEPCDDVPLVCRKIKEAGMKVGLAIKPGTPVTCVEEYIDMADMILVMTVEPGFGGQKFMKDMMPKIELLREKYPTMDIEVDGGIGPNNIDVCAMVICILCNKIYFLTKYSLEWKYLYNMILRVLVNHMTYLLPGIFGYSM